MAEQKIIFTADEAKYLTSIQKMIEKEAAYQNKLKETQNVIKENKKVSEDAQEEISSGYDDLTEKIGKYALGIAKISTAVTGLKYAWELANKAAAENFQSQRTIGDLSNQENKIVLGYANQMGSTPSVARKELIDMAQRGGYRTLGEIVNFGYAARSAGFSDEGRNALLDFMSTRGVSPEATAGLTGALAKLVKNKTSVSDLITTAGKINVAQLNAQTNLNEFSNAIAVAGPELLGQGFGLDYILSLTGTTADYRANAVTGAEYARQIPRQLRKPNVIKEMAKFSGMKPDVFLESVSGQEDRMSVFNMMIGHMIQSGAGEMKISQMLGNEEMARALVSSGAGFLSKQAGIQKAIGGVTYAGEMERTAQIQKETEYKAMQAETRASLMLRSASENIMLGEAESKVAESAATIAKSKKRFSFGDYLANAPFELLTPGCDFGDRNVTIAWKEDKIKQAVERIKREAPGAVKTTFRELGLGGRGIYITTTPETRGMQLCSYLSTPFDRYSDIKLKPEEKGEIVKKLDELINVIIKNEADRSNKSPKIGDQKSPNTQN